MGRSPCCEKVGLKKGPWTPEEDQKLLAYIEEHGHGSWRALPTKAGLQRCGKSCRLRWTNYLRPDIKRGKFSLQEEQTIIQLHALLGNRWSTIATHLPKRTDNEIKNYWNTHLKKRLAKMGIDPVTHKPKNDVILSSSGGETKYAANLSHMAQWESARLEAEARLIRQSKIRNSVQNSELADSSNQIQKPAGKGLFLDVLKAGKTADGCADIGSPTSTLSSTARNGESSSAVYEHVPCGTFVEKFTDLLLGNNSGGERCLANESGESEDGAGVSGVVAVEGGSQYHEDNTNYWNSILNLVNSSPFDSPIF